MNKEEFLSKYYPRQFLKAKPDILMGDEMENDLNKLLDEYAEQESRENNSFWFDVFNERYPDEVKEILDNMNNI